MRDDVIWSQLEGEKIVKTKWGNPSLGKYQPYGAMTLFTESGREFVVTQCMGEVQLSEVRKG